MKKLLAVAIVAVMVLALSVSTFAMTALDYIATEQHNTLGTRDDTNEKASVVAENGMHIEPGDKLYITGWAMPDKDDQGNPGEAYLSKIVYTVNGGDPVDCENRYRGIFQR